MKVIFDHELFSRQRFGGASKYFTMLLSHMPREMWETTTLWSNNAYVDSVNLFNHYHFLKQYFFRGQGRIMSYLNTPYTLKHLYKRDYDVFHQTHFGAWPFNAIGSKPMVMTFHDINFLTLNPKPREVERQKKSLNRADKIITVSNNTKKDLLEYYDAIDEGKVEVIYHGIELPKTVISYPSIINHPYILYVGTRSNHKNFERFVQAFGLFHRKCSEIKLVCTYKPFTKEEFALFHSCGIEDNAIMAVSVDETGMRSLYQNALFFAFPSLYEGFGMPILEAWSNNCPCVLSNASCFPEIAQDAALYFDPTAIEDMAYKLEMMTNDSALREQYKNLGAERVKLFSWDKCAQEHIRVYKSLI